MSIYVGDKEIKNLFAGESTEKDYSAMQGPAPDGFHVPLTTEWQGLKTIMDGLSLTTGNSWRINLHMPFAGRRNYSTAGLSSQGAYGYYWSSSPCGSDSPYYARLLYLYSSYVGANDYDERAGGLSVRCFKDSYVAPDSNWTVVQGTLGSAGIFWNQTDGLISITNGTTGYTIQDKNLGATTVYNDGDTLTQANMGNMYQWGNNYGFTSTGSVSKTSSTQVNAQDYGPGNYYENDTFIIGNDDWSNVQNDDLRGGVTGITEKQKEAKEIYLGDVKVWPSLLTYEEIVAMANAEGYPWTNTIAELNNNPTEYYNMLSQGNHMEDAGYHGPGTTYPIIKGIISYNPTPQKIYTIYYINNLFVCDYNTGGGD